MAYFLSAKRSRPLYPLLPAYDTLTKRQRAVVRYGVAFAAVGVATLLSIAFSSVFEGAPFLLFWPVVIISTWYGALGPGLLSIALSTIAVSLIFHDPTRYTGKPLIDALQVFLFVLMSVSLSWLHDRRRQAEQWIVEQGRWFRTTLSSLGDGVIVTGTEGNVLFMNPPACGLTGWSAAEAVGQHVEVVYRVLDEATREPLPNPALRVLFDAHSLGEATPALLVARGGAECPVENSATPVRDEDGTLRGAVLVFHDISRRRRAEAAVEQRETWLRAAREASLDGFMVLRTVRDAGGKIVDFEWEYANQAVHTIAGYPREALVGKRLLDLSPGSIRPDGPFEWCVQVAETREPFSVERNVPGTGRWVRTDIVSLDDGVAVTFTDLTPIKGNEARLKASEQRLQQAKSAAGLGIHDYDVLTGRIEWDTRIRELWGVDDDADIFYDTFIGGIHPDDRERIQAEVDAALDPAGSGEYWTTYRVVNQRDGATRWVEATGRVQFEERRGVRMVGTVQDVTERKRSELALQAERALLETVLNHLPMSVCMLRGNDLSIQLVNDAYQAIGPGKVMLGKTLDEVWPETGQNFSELCRRVLETGKAYQVEDGLSMIRRTPDGPLESAYFSWSLNRIRLPEDGEWGILNVALETTSRKRTEQALIEVEELVRRQLAEIESIYASAPIGLGVLDTSLRFVRINERLAEMNGVPSIEHIGRAVREIVPNLADQVEASFRQIIETGAPLLNVEVQGETRAQPGLTRYWVENWMPLKDGAGRTIGINIAADEVTDRVRNVQRLQLLRDVAVALAGSLTPADVVRVLAGSGIEALGASRSVVVLIDDAKTMLETVATLGYAEVFPESMQRLSLDRPDVALVVSVRTGQAIWSEALPDSPPSLPPLPPVDDQAEEDGAWACLPLRTNSDIVGGVCFHFDGPHRFDDHERSFMLSVVDYCAQALGRVLLSEAAKKAATTLERERLARELHDAVSQSLFAASIIAESLRQSWQKSPDKIPDRLDQLYQLTRGAQAEMRTLLLELRPAALVASKMKALLAQLADAMRSRRPMDIQLDVDEWEPPLPDVKIGLYRIAQEALNNVVKHSGATRVVVSLKGHNGGIEMYIADDGHGFDPQAVGSSRLGLGIMQERASSIGATIDVQSRPGGGTSVTVQWTACSKD